MGLLGWLTSKTQGRAPRAAASTLRVVPIRAKYDAAQTTSNNVRHWALADALSPRSALSASVRRVLRNRSRYETENNSYARGMLSTLVSYTIGAGPDVGIEYIGTELSGERLSRTTATVNRLFWEWWDEADMPRKLATTAWAVARDGEGFLVRYTAASPYWRCPVRLNFRPLEADHFEASTYGLVSDDAGVITDRNGDVTGYYFLPEHPGDAVFSTARALPISARDVYHLYRCDRPGQLRGVPWLTPALGIFATMRRFTMATLDAAETAANHAAVLTTEAGPDGDDDAAIGEPFEAIEIERNVMLTLPAGYKMSQFRAEHPNAQYETFITANVREAARCIDMPAVLAIDASKYNYASGRLDLQAFWRSRQAERSLIYERQCITRAYRDWLDEALLIPGYLPPDFASTARDWLAVCRWTEAEHVDRSKEAAGQAAELANHTTTLAREYARRGLYWEDELRQRARELALMRELELSPAAASPQPTSQADPATDAGDEEPADTEDIEEDATA